MKEKRVLFPLIKLESGADIYFRMLERGYKQRGYQTEFYFYPKILIYFPSLLKIIKKKNKADIIHTTGELGFAFKEKNKELYVSILHIPKKTKFFNPGFIKNIYYKCLIIPNIRKSIIKADKVFAISNYTKREAQKLYNKEIEVEYPEIDKKVFKKVRVNSTDKRFRLLFVGNLIRRKGVDLLPKIMMELGDDYVLYYTSGLRGNIKKEFNLKNMIPLGRLSQKELALEYNKCSVVLYPTRLEGFGYPIAEAGACKKPVIASNCSSIPELKKLNKKLILAEPNNIKDFVNKIRKLKNEEK